jgi:hypothetical protein
LSSDVLVTVEYPAAWARPTETSELTVTDPEPDAPVESASDVTEQAPAAPPSERRRWRPTRVQVLALVGAFLVGACLCGGLGLAIGAAVFHQRPGFSERGDFGPRGRHGEGRNGVGKNGRDGQVQIRPIKPTPAPSATVPSPAASVTPATSPS